MYGKGVVASDAVKPYMACQGSNERGERWRRLT